MSYPKFSKRFWLGIFGATTVGVSSWLMIGKDRNEGGHLRIEDVAYLRTALAEREALFDGGYWLGTNSITLPDDLDDGSLRSLLTNSVPTNFISAALHGPGNLWRSYDNLYYYWLGMNRADNRRIIVPSYWGDVETRDFGSEWSWETFSTNTCFPGAITNALPEVSFSSLRERFPVYLESSFFNKAASVLPLVNTIASVATKYKGSHGESILKPIAPIRIASDAPLFTEVWSSVTGYSVTQETWNVALLTQANNNARTKFYGALTEDDCDLIESPVLARLSLGYFLIGGGGVHGYWDDETNYWAFADWSMSLIYPKKDLFFRTPLSYPGQEVVSNAYLICEARFETVVTNDFVAVHLDFFRDRASDMFGAPDVGYDIYLLPHYETILRKGLFFKILLEPSTEEDSGWPFWKLPASRWSDDLPDNWPYFFLLDSWEDEMSVRMEASLGGTVTLRTVALVVEGMFETYQPSITNWTGVLYYDP